MPTLSYSEVIHEIESRGIMPKSAPSLHPMKEGLKALSASLEMDAEKIIVVAGTNGKGSVCATLSALLQSAGQTVGMYTSPHLEDTTERIRINGKNITEKHFLETYHEVQRRTSNLFLTHFEILTLMAAWYFFSNQCVRRVDWAIFEVGLGGTWDATNAIPHRNCVITSLGFDHQNLLGNTLEEIASNKFGIVQPGARVVHSALPMQVRSLAADIRTQTQSHWTESAPFRLRVDHENQHPIFRIETQWGEATLSLPGMRGAENTATALTLFHELGFSPKDHISALTHVDWPGRMERVIYSHSPCPIYFSGDHNVPGVESLLQLLSNYPRKRLFILAGIGRDKDMDGILSPLFGLEDAQIFLTETPFRGRALQEYGKWLSQAHGSYADPKVALEQIFQICSSDDLILITGSLYLVGFLRSALKALR